MGAPASLSRTSSNLGDISRDMSEIFRVYGVCGCGCREGVGEAREMRKRILWPGVAGEGRDRPRSAGYRREGPRLTEIYPRLSEILCLPASYRVEAEAAGEGEEGGGREERRGAEWRGGEAAWAVACSGGGERGDGRQLNHLCW